jgi:hypothetical protein
LDPNSNAGVGLGNHSSQPGPWNYPFRGRVDELSVYHRAISASEVKAIYRADTAGKFDPATSGPEALAKARVTVSGIATNSVLGNNTNWQSSSLNFTANQNGTALQIEGLEPGILLDSFSLSEASEGGPLYVLPEQPLGALVGTRAFGNWTLEIWDNRAGPAGTNIPPTLLSWELSFIFEHAVPKPIDIVHGVTQTNTVAPGQVQYFTVKVPYWASFATN